MVLSVLWGAPGLQTQKTTNRSTVILEKLTNLISGHCETNFSTKIIIFHIDHVHRMGKHLRKFGGCTVKLSMIFMTKIIKIAPNISFSKLTPRHFQHLIHHEFITDVVFLDLKIFHIDKALI